MDTIKVRCSDCGKVVAATSRPRPRRLPIRLSQPQPQEEQFPVGGGYSVPRYYYERHARRAGDPTSCMKSDLEVPHQDVVDALYREPGPNPQ